MYLNRRAKKEAFVCYRFPRSTLKHVGAGEPVVRAAHSGRFFYILKFTLESLESSIRITNIMGSKVLFTKYNIS